MNEFKLLGVLGQAIAALKISIGYSDNAIRGIVNVELANADKSPLPNLGKNVEIEALTDLIKHLITCRDGAATLINGGSNFHADYLFGMDSMINQAKLRYVYLTGEAFVEAAEIA